MAETCNNNNNNNNNMDMIIYSIEETQKSFLQKIHTNIQKMTEIDQKCRMLIPSMNATNSAESKAASDVYLIWMRQLNKLRAENVTSEHILTELGKFKEYHKNSLQNNSTHEGMMSIDPHLLTI